LETQYLSIAIQYYIAGRSAAFAGSIPVAGSLLHHAVEMLLKSFLLKQYTAAELKDEFRHDLKKLWRAFKNIANEPPLGRFDGLVSALNRVEEVRYPGRGYVFSIVRQKAPRQQVSGTATKGVKQYYVNLEDVDEYVTALLTGRVTTGWIAILLQGEDAKKQYSRENSHPYI
jgi:hypothetical protein